MSHVEPGDFRKAPPFVLTAMSICTLRHKDQGIITKRIRGPTEAALDAIVGCVIAVDDGLFDLETCAVPVILVVPDFRSCTPRQAGCLPA
ncbi:MAG: hypothetical protein HKL99_11320 [Burkholderiales bacterium]|jgi:hypothetical protein|nr:hypothetical protein [Burkholderiales bacterium]